MRHLVLNCKPTSVSPLNIPLHAAAAGLQEGPLSAQEGPTLLAPAGCARLQHLGLDWLKLRRSCLDSQVVHTLAACTALTSLSLMGYQGSIDEVRSAREWLRALRSS